jgi:hypothetical protein
MPDELTLRFECERETKNTIRYLELAEDGEYVVGSLDVRKAELARLGDPEARELVASLSSSWGGRRWRPVVRTRGASAPREAWA